MGKFFRLLFFSFAFVSMATLWSAPKKTKNNNPYDWNNLELSAEPIFEQENLSLPANEIDKIVDALCKKNAVPRTKFASDAVFIRRAYLDLTGTLPSPESLEKFLRDTSQDKRIILIDKLLNSDEFVDYWAIKFGDILRIKAEFPVNLWPNAAQAYDRFVRESLRNGLGWNVMTKRMLTASGSNFRIGEVNFYRAMQSRTADSAAACVALTFMGARFEKFSPKTRAEMTKFFSRLRFKATKEWKEDIVVNDISKRAPFKGILPDGWVVDVPADADPREIFADWLTAKGNPYFAKAFANRAWAWIFGDGIVSPADDMFAENKARSPELLEHLARFFEASNFNIRALLRHITTSRLYSTSFIPAGDATKARKFFAVYPVRRLDAEVVIDILGQISGTSEIYSSTTPEPYTTLPDYSRALEVPDGSITTSFLELFGKPSRDTGTMAERNNNPNSSQKLYMINSSHIRDKLAQGKRIINITNQPQPIAFEKLYHLILSRSPSLAERDVFKAQRVDWKRMQDLVWALVNSEEFINRH